MGSHSSAFVQICAERLILTVVLTVVENAIGSFTQITTNIEFFLYLLSLLGHEVNIFTLTVKVLVVLAENENILL